MAVKTWVWVVVGVAIVGVLGLFALAGAGIYFFSRAIETRTVTPESADQLFAEARSRFPKDRPLIEVDEDDRVHRVTSPGDRPTAPNPPSQLHVLAYDADDEKIVRVTLPFWLLRLGDSGAIDLGSHHELDLEKVKLDIDELERIGPALILDHRGRRGERVLVWSQ
jgi:hypothetical protein